MITSRHLSPDRSLAVEISLPQDKNVIGSAEVVSRSDGRRQKLEGIGLIPQLPVLFLANNNIIIVHDGSSSSGRWPVAFRRILNGGPAHRPSSLEVASCLSHGKIAFLLGLAKVS